MTERNKKPEPPISLEALVAEIDREAEEVSGNIGGLPSRIIPPFHDDKAEEDHTYEQYIRFFIEDIPLILPISSALEIGRGPGITPLPNLPDWVLGVSNIRGEIVSVVDLKAFLKLPSGRVRRSQRFIIVYNHEMKVGLIVDRIMGILSLDRADFIQGSPYEKGEIASYISGVVSLEDRQSDHMLNIFDIDKLLSSPRMTAFRNE